MLVSLAAAGIGAGVFASSGGASPEGLTPGMRSHGSG